MSSFDGLAGASLAFTILVTLVLITILLIFFLPGFTFVRRARKER